MLVCPPCNTFLHQWNRCFGPIGVKIEQLQCVIKHAVCNRSTWGDGFVVTANAVRFTLLAWMRKRKSVSIELAVISRLHIPSMILVEV